MDNDKLDLDQIRAVIQIASEADLAELEVESPSLKISVKRSPRLSSRSGDAPSAFGGRAGTTESPSASGDGAVDSDTVPIVAPMVGTFYRAPTPGAPPFVHEGDLITPGQTVCIIEAMKLFNEIQSDLQGTIVKILLENAVPVEYGQPLFLVRPPASVKVS